MSVMKINTTPIVSVVIPIFKHSPAQLIRAINSILSQTLTDFEFIIIDGNPNGNNKKIIRRFADCRIKYFKTIGYINCLNLGISKSRSKYIARMESIANHCGFNIYTSFAYFRTYFAFDVKQTIKKWQNLRSP